MTTILHLPRQATTSKRIHRLNWEYGSAEIQTLGAMLGPLKLCIDSERELDIMHVAPWANTTEAGKLQGMLKRMRGEWPCFPFGRSDTPRDLPPAWTTRQADDHWPHGYAAHHDWTCIEASATHVHLAIDYPAECAIARAERIISADPAVPAIDIALRLWARRATRIPGGLHPVFHLPGAPERVKLELGKHLGIHSYPASPAGAVSRLLPDVRSDSLARLRGIDGPLDLSLLPSARVGEEILQVESLQEDASRAPLVLRYLDYAASVGMWWDHEQFPDLLLWVSNGGRINYPWMGRHIALGAEPVNSLFDLGRVATAPPGHPLAKRLGISLDPASPWQTSYRIAAWADAATRNLDGARA